MFQPQINPWSKLDKQMIVGMLKSTNSKDPDVIYGQKMTLAQTIKLANTIGTFGYIFGGLFFITIIFWMGGVMFIAAGWWAKQRYKHNAGILDSAYEEYLTSLKSA